MVYHGEYTNYKLAASQRASPYLYQFSIYENSYMDNERYPSNYNLQKLRVPKIIVKN